MCFKIAISSIKIASFNFKKLIYSPKQQKFHFEAHILKKQCLTLKANKHSAIQKLFEHLFMNVFTMINTIDSAVKYEYKAPEFI